MGTKVVRSQSFILLVVSLAYAASFLEEVDNLLFPRAQGKTRVTFLIFLGMEFFNIDAATFFRK